MARCDKLVDVGRRAFFARTAAAAAGAAVTASLPGSGARAAEAAPALALVTYPAARLANIKDLKVDEPINITYPDQQSPGILLKLGHPVVGGVGPDQDVVAFSTMCPHKGFPLFYRASDKSLNCPGHYSRFDVEKGGLEIWGHATQNLPQFRLRVDQNGDIYAQGVDELLYGRLSNILQA